MKKQIDINPTGKPLREIKVKAWNVNEHFTDMILVLSARSIAHSIYLSYSARLLITLIFSTCFQLLFTLPLYQPQVPDYLSQVWEVSSVAWSVVWLTDPDLFLHWIPEFWFAPIMACSCLFPLFRLLFWLCLLANISIPLVLLNLSDLLIRTHALLPALGSASGLSCSSVSAGFHLQAAVLRFGNSLGSSSRLLWKSHPTSLHSFLCTRTNLGTRLVIHMPVIGPCLSLVITNLNVCFYRKSSKPLIFESCIFQSFQ